MKVLHLIVGVTIADASFLTAAEMTEACFAQHREPSISMPSPAMRPPPELCWLPPD
jgi:hypothetical protein